MRTMQHMLETIAVCRPCTYHYCIPLPVKQSENTLETSERTSELYSVVDKK